ncbi:MAG: mercuric transport protein MerTP [Bacteroidetes bacterium]|nr:mercuric transport protein MerTP [Bacteroidota bacterium]
MSTEKTSHKTWIAAIIASIVASLCCITPVFAFLAGISGIASTFSSLGKIRPYLIGLTLLILAFAWYQKLRARTKEEMECETCEDKKPSFWQSKKFLGIVTVFTILILAFPNYAYIFFPKWQEKQVIIIDKSNIQKVKLSLEGMYCEACALTINDALSKVPGVLESKTSYTESMSIIKYDKSKTNIDALEKAVSGTGYKVSRFEILKD